MTPKTLKIALALSLALNVFAIGAVAGAGYMRQRLVEPRAERGPPMLRIAERLPEEKREAFRARMRQEGLAARPLIRQAREARRDAVELFGQPQYDPKAAAGALGRARDSEFAARAQLENAMADFALTLTPQERAELAKAMQPRRRGGGPGGERRGPQSGGGDRP